MKHILALIASCALAAAASAQSIDTLEVKPGATPLDYIFTVKVSGGACGVALDFGDDQVASHEAAPGKPVAFGHTYKTAGTYAVLAYGKPIRGFLAPTPECEVQALKLAWVVDPQTLDDSTLDVLLLARTRGGRGDASRFATNIDGSPRLADPKAPLCVSTALLRDINSNTRGTAEVVQAAVGAHVHSVLGLAQLYRQLEVDNIASVATTQAEQLLRKMGASKPIDECRGRVGLDTLYRADVVAVPRGYLPLLTQLRQFEDLKQFVTLATVPFSEVRNAGVALKEKQAANQQAQASTIDEFTTLAAQNSRARVGSLVLGEDRSKVQKVCAVTYKDADGAALLGYRALDLDMLLPDTRERFTRAGYTLGGEGRRGFDKVFGDINEAYLELSKKPDQCQVFVDFPANLLSLQNALKRDRREAPKLGALSDAEAARERFATRRGFASYAELQFASSIRAGVGEFKKLKAAGITDRAGFDAAIAEMQKSGHSTGVDLPALMVYLGDRDDARARNVSVVAQREFRIAQEKKAEAQAEAISRKRRADYVREYPFEAVLTCGFQGRHTTIAACFAGGSHSVDTELEVRNGTDYALYRPWEIRRAGNEIAGQGLVIPLRRKFDIKAQNADETLTLTLTIRDTETGKELYVKSAAKYGVVSANR